MASASTSSVVPEGGPSTPAVWTLPGARYATPSPIVEPVWTIVHASCATDRRRAASRGCASSRSADRDRENFLQRIPLVAAHLRTQESPSRAAGRGASGRY